MKNLCKLAALFFPAIVSWAQTDTYTNQFGTRSYKVFVPTQLPAKSPLLVVLHGCLMNGDQMAEGTGFHRLAETGKFVVVFPQQGQQDNPMKCWNWFKPENHLRDTGEASIIVGITKDMIAKHGIDQQKVFLAGLSAGSAMAANLLACYSDIFAGALLSSGLTYAAAGTDAEAKAAMKNGSPRIADDLAQQALQCSPNRSRLLSAMIVHGNTDTVVDKINAMQSQTFLEKYNELLWAQQTGTSPLISKRQIQEVRKLPQHSFDILEIQFGGGYRIRLVQVSGMGHAWSGGKVTAPYMDSFGPDVAQTFVDEFMN